MDNLINENKVKFQQTTAQISKLYMESQKCKETQYIQGKEDAFFEVIKLL